MANQQVVVTDVRVVRQLSSPFDADAAFCILKAGIKAVGLLLFQGNGLSVEPMREGLLPFFLPPPPTHL